MPGNPAKRPASKAANAARPAKPDRTKKTAKYVASERLELLITTVNRSKAEYYIDLLHAFDINLQLVVPGRGTADANMLAMFGLTDSEKAVIFSVIREDRINDALEILEKKFRTIRNGKGVAYTVPLTGVIGTLIFGFLSNNKKTVK